MNKFEAGKTYEGYSINGAWLATIESRTEKTITVDGKKYKIYAVPGYDFEQTQSGYNILRSSNLVE